MQGTQQDEMQYGPRIGDSPLPGHWAAGIPGFAGSAWLAHGLDCLADEAGLADGLSLLLKACGVTTGQVRSAGPQQLRDWFGACYAGHASRPLRGNWDVVAFSRGIYSPGSGWCPPDDPVPADEESCLCPGYIAENHTDEYITPEPAAACSVTW